MSHQTNLVWLQPKRNTDALYYDISTAARRSLNSAEPSAEEQKIVEHLQRPTKSSAAKRDPALIKRLNTMRYQEADKQIAWSRMEYFQDCMNCMWKNNGTIKGSSKI